MQYGFDIKIKKARPKFGLHSTVENFLGWFGIKGTQVTLNEVPFSNVKTKKFTIGAPGVTGCDFNFASAANTTEQVINLGAIVPAMARVLDIKAKTLVAYVGATTLVAEVGHTSSGNQYIASATIMAENAIIAAASAACLAIAPVNSAVSVYVAATPGANWSGVSAGKTEIWVTYIEV